MKNYLKRTDYKLFVAITLLALFGILMIYSASSYSAEKDYGDAFYYVKKQAIALILGIVAALLASKINIELLKKYRFVVLGVSLLLL